MQARFIALGVLMLALPGCASDEAAGDLDAATETEVREIETGDDIAPDEVSAETDSAVDDDADASPTETSVDSASDDSAADADSTDTAVDDTIADGADSADTDDTTDTADTADADTTTPVFDPTDGASAFYTAPDYDDTTANGLWRPRVGPDVFAWVIPPVADFGAPVFETGSVVPLSSDAPLAGLVGAADYHLFAIVRPRTFAADTGTDYTNALVVGDTDGHLGLSLERTADGTARATLWQFDADGSHAAHVALADAPGDLVLQAKRAPAADGETYLWIRVGSDPWVRGDACGPLADNAGNLRIGVSYANITALDGTITGLALYPAARDDTFSDALVTWARERKLGWVRATLGELPAEWLVRDGAHLVPLGSGATLLIGGWNPSDPWPLGVGGVRVTNEVWRSDDDGAHWSLVLPHDSAPPKSGPGARFMPLHVAAVATWRGHAVVVGADVPNGEVWHESDDGATWTLVADDAPSFDHHVSILGALGDSLYYMGGQTSMGDARTADAHVWRSTDGGVHWTQLADAPWAGRGMVLHPVEHAGQLYVIGGGRYDELHTVSYNGVYTFDGETWTTILPEGHDQFAPSFWHSLASVDGRLWLFNGYGEPGGNMARALFSDDDGTTWSTFIGPGGAASHADAVAVVAGRVLRISGDLGERRVNAYFVAP